MSTPGPLQEPTGVIEDRVHHMHVRINRLHRCFGLCEERFIFRPGISVNHETYFNKYLDCMRLCILVADSSPGLHIEELLKTMAEVTGKYKD